MQTGNTSLDGTNITDDWVNSTTIPTQVGPSLQTPELYIRAIIGTLVLLVTFFGNTLVLYVFATTRKLRTYTNYYIVGLAVADLISGGITPALENVSWILDTWPFGETLCATNVYINHLFLHATFLMTLTICVDRYRAVTMPLKHLREKTLKHALKMMSFSYIIPLLVWTPLIIILPYSGVTDRILPPLCYGSYDNHFPLLIFAISIMSWIPMLLTILLYLFVFRAIIRGRRNAMDNHQPGGSITHEMETLPRYIRKPKNGGWGNGDTSGTQNSTDDLRRMSATGQTPEATSSTVDGSEKEGYQWSRTENDTEFHEAVQTKKARPCYSKKAKPAFKTHPKTSRLQCTLSTRRRRSLRTTRSLMTYIIVVNVVSALPWSIFAFWGVLNNDSTLGLSEFKTMSWLVHLRSAANPLCYAVWNPLFKQAYLRVLCCGRREHH